MKRTGLILATIGLFARSVGTAQILIDNFDTYPVGPLYGASANWVTHVSNVIAIAQDPLDPGNKVLALVQTNISGITAQQGAYFILPNVPGTTIADGETKTVFLRFMTSGTGVDQSFGLTTVDNPATALGDTGGWGDFRVQGSVLGTVFRVRDIGGARPLANLTAGTWYNLWMVVSNASGTVDDGTIIYLNSTPLAGATESDRLWWGTTNVFSWRNGGTTETLDRFYVKLQQSSAGTTPTVWIDDIYVMDGVSLINPIPEPASMAVVIGGTGVVLALLRRRKDR